MKLRIYFFLKVFTPLFLGPLVLWSLRSFLQTEVLLLILFLLCLYVSFKVSAFMHFAYETLAREIKSDVSFNRSFRDYFKRLRIDSEKKQKLEKKKEQERSREKELTTKILKSMGSGFMIFDESRRIVRMNNSALTLFEMNRKDVLGRDYKEVFKDSAFISFANDLSESKKKCRDEITLANGKILFIQGRYIKSDDDIFVLVFDDITSMRSFEDSRKSFVANVSHELKTPLTTILGYLETVLESELSPSDKEFIQIAYDKSLNLAQIIDDLLFLSRVEGQKDLMKRAKESFQTSDLAGKAMRKMERKAKKKKIDLVLEGEGQEVSAYIHLGLVELALSNLIDNAIKFSPDGQKIIIKCCVNHDHLEMSVQDFGPGVEKQDQQRIFERFFQVDSSRSQTSGIGLGLSLVKHIVRIHSGDLSIESELNRGSKFTIRIELVG